MATTELVATVPSPRRESRLDYAARIDYLYTLRLAEPEVHGTVTVAGASHRWFARWCRLPVAALVPGAERPHLADDDGFGFLFHLPPVLAEQADPLVVRRLLVALEAYLYRLRAGRTVYVPHVARFAGDGTSDGTAGPALATDRQSSLFVSVSPGAVGL